MSDGDDRITIVFDVNETLLDVRSLSPAFEESLGDASLLPVWFGLLLRNSFIASATRTYRPFDVQAVDALKLVIRQRALDVDEAVADNVVSGMAQLPAHDDVVAGLDLLTDAGFRLATLTNSPPHLAVAQLEFAGIADRFERILSVEATGRFKPSPEPYDHAAAELGRAAAELTLVAAHDWDITGAMRVGWSGAFVARPGAVLGDLGESPDIIGRDIADVASQLIAASG